MDIIERIINLQKVENEKQSNITIYESYKNKTSFELMNTITNFSEEFKDIVTDIYTRTNIETTHGIVNSAIYELNKVLSYTTKEYVDSNDFELYEDNMIIINPINDVYVINAADNCFSYLILNRYLKELYEFYFGFKYKEKKHIRLIDIQTQMDYKSINQTIRLIYEDEKAKRYGYSYTVDYIDEDTITYVLDRAKEGFNKKFGHNIIIDDEDIKMKNIY